MVCYATIAKARGLPYSQGDLNRLVDSIVHPLMKGDAKIPARVLDTELHFIIERNIETSTKKFIKYSLPRIISDFAKSDAAKPKKVSRKRKAKNHTDSSLPLSGI